MLRYIILAAAALLALGAASAYADEPTLEVSSPHSLCTDPLTFRGSGYEPGETIAVGIPGMAEMTFLVATDVAEDGTFEVTLTLGNHGAHCTAGAELLFFAYRGVDQLEERPLASAVHSTATPWRLSLESCEPLVVDGRGLPPGRRFVLLGGDDAPFAHDFAIVDQSNSDADGRIRFEVDQFGVSSFCRYGALFVRFYQQTPSDPSVEARISLPSGVQRAPPLPADTGAGVAQPSSGGVALPVAAALLALAVPLVRTGRRT